MPQNRTFNSAAQVSQDIPRPTEDQTAKMATKMRSAFSDAELKAISASNNALRSMTISCLPDHTLWFDVDWQDFLDWVDDVIEGLQD